MPDQRLLKESPLDNSPHLLKDPVHGKTIGYILRYPNSASLLASFDQGAPRALDRAQAFDRAEVATDNARSFVRNARQLYMPHAVIHSSEYHALKGIFYAHAGFTQKERQEQETNYVTTFGAKAQKHLVTALYSLDLASQMRLFDAGKAHNDTLDTQWTHVFRGAQAVAHIAKTLAQLHTTVALPVSHIDRRYGIDLFCIRQDQFISFQIKAFGRSIAHASQCTDTQLGRDTIVRTGESKKIGWNRKTAEHFVLSQRHDDFNREYTLNCESAFANIELPYEPPFTPDTPRLLQSFQEFLHKIS